MPTTVTRAARYKTTFLVLLTAAGFFAQAQTTGANDYQLLPENLTYFTAARSGKAVSLEGQTVNEQHSKGFSVQQKTTGDWGNHRLCCHPLY